MKDRYAVDCTHCDNWVVPLSDFEDAVMLTALFFAGKLDKQQVQAFEQASQDGFDGDPLDWMDKNELWSSDAMRNRFRNKLVRFLEQPKQLSLNLEG